MILYIDLIWWWNILEIFTFLCFFAKINIQKCCHATPFSCPCGLFMKIFFHKRNFGAFLQKYFAAKKTGIGSKKIKIRNMIDYHVM